MHMPRGGIKPMCCVFQASMLYHLGPLLFPSYSCLSVCAAPCLRGQCRLPHSSPWHCKSLKWSFNACNYKHTVNVHIHTQARFNKHTVCSLYRVLVMAPWGDENWKYCIQSVNRTRILCHCANHYTTKQDPCLPVYVASYLRGQGRLLP